MPKQGCPACGCPRCLLAQLRPSHSTLQAYLTVAPYVAAFPEYSEPLAWHLLRAKLRHWDKGLRELAAQALAGEGRAECSAPGAGRAQQWQLACMVCRRAALTTPPRACPAPAALVPHRTAFFLDQALPFLLPLCTDAVLEVRHGAVAAVAELLPALRCGAACGCTASCAGAANWPRHPHHHLAPVHPRDPAG